MTDDQADAALEQTFRTTAKYKHGARFYRAIFDAGRAFERTRCLKLAEPWLPGDIADEMRGSPSAPGGGQGGEGSDTR